MNSFPLSLASAWGSRKSYKRVNTNTSIRLANRDKSFIFYLRENELVASVVVVEP